MVTGFQTESDLVRVDALTVDVEERRGHVVKEDLHARIAHDGEGVDASLWRVEERGDGGVAANVTAGI